MDFGAIDAIKFLEEIKARSDVDPRIIGQIDRLIEKIKYPPIIGTVYLEAKDVREDSE